MAKRLEERGFAVLKGPSPDPQGLLDAAAAKGMSLPLTADGALPRSISRVHSSLGAPLSLPYVTIAEAYRGVFDPTCIACPSQTRAGRPLFDGIALLNVLDRCDTPITLLRQLRRAHKAPAFRLRSAAMPRHFTNDSEE